MESTDSNTNFKQGILYGEEVCVEVFVEGNQYDRIENMHKCGNVSMPGFDGFFRAVAHALHATFAVESPEWPVVNFNNCFNRASFDTQTAIVAIG